MFKNYAWLSIFGLIITVLLIFLCVEASGERIAMFGSAFASAAAFCYFVQQQKLAETALFKDLFINFNARYDLLNNDLDRIASDNNMSLDDAGRKVVIDYFNLCAEEYFFFSEGYIPPAVWKSWCRGMKFYMECEPIKSAWEKEEKLGSYYGLSAEAIRRWS